jgi:hypothetical protein
MTRSRLMMGAWILAAVLVLAAGTVRAHAFATATARACGTFSGTAWEDLVKGVKGSQWKVVAVGVKCSYARSWAIKLAKPSYKGRPAGAIRGPAGWKCYSAIDVAGGTPGECRKGLKTHFAWGYTSQDVG